MNWNNTYLNISSYIPCTKVEGPGKRFSIWVQGCLKRCKGCCNPGELEIIKKHLIPTNILLEKIAASKIENDIEGITLLGGEPILQAKGLSFVAEQSQSMGLSVMLFTGYTYKELKKNNLPYYMELISKCDIVVEGPYDISKPDNKRNWVGSRNQKFHYQGNQYNKEIELNHQYIDGIEFRIQKKDLFISGYPFPLSVGIEKNNLL